jgi:hypothetical protein
MDYQSNASIGDGDTAEMGLCSSSFILCVSHAMNAQRMVFQENRSNGSRDTAKELACSARTLTFIAIRNQTYTACSKCVESPSYGVAGESAQLKPRYTRKGILFPK